MTILSGWRVALRLAWREAWRAKGRSLLVLVMVTFPVVAVVAADVARATSNVSSVEGLDRRLGSAAARVAAYPDAGHLVQSPDAGAAAWGGPQPRPTLGRILTALGGPRPTAELRVAGRVARTDRGGVLVTETGVDLRDPLADGLFRLTSGRLAARVGEVDINAALASYGFGIGDRLHIGRSQPVTVVGLAESTDTRNDPLVVGPLGTLPPPGPALVRTYLVGGGPVSWNDVRAVNRVGATVLSRAVVEHPPSSDQLPSSLRAQMSSGTSRIYPVLALVAVMVLIEVVLLAGPAFAVGARRQARTLALQAANGGTPAQARRTVLATAVVLGSVGGAVGVLLGIGLARAFLPVLQGMSNTWFGPFQVPWAQVLVISLFGLVSALLAAVVPAWVASRQDVVAVLTGRRGDRRPSLRSPVVGVVLVAAGVVTASLGARRDAGELMIATAAVLAVLGMILLVPLVVAGVGRLGRGFPLPLRYAVRDAARHRTRTVPAVAAVAATVAGVVALSIANTSDQAQAKADYVPQLPTGMSSLEASGGHVDWGAFRAAIEQEAPSARVSQVAGVDPRHFWDVGLTGRDAMPAEYTSGFNTPVVVSDGQDPALRDVLAGFVDREQVSRATAALARGQAVAFTGDRSGPGAIELSVGRGKHRHHGRFPALYVDVSPRAAPTQAIVPPAVVRELGQRVRTVGLLMSGPPLTRAQASRLNEVFFGIDRNSYLYVERGYVTPGSAKVVLWILFGLAAVLMLGGTLTATFLALSDARPDLATLSAVGASPRTRRAVAAAYAVSVGMVGAVLGAAVGFIPGIAVSYPLTRNVTGSGPSHFLVIPWPQIVALVLLLPLLTALVVGVVTRSRLPMVARLD